MDACARDWVTTGLGPKAGWINSVQVPQLQDSFPPVRHPNMILWWGLAGIVLKILIIYCF